MTFLLGIALGAGTVAFLAGAFVGACLGFLLAAILAAGRRD